MIFLYLSLSCLFLLTYAVDIEKSSDNNDFAGGIDEETKFVDREEPSQEDEAPVVQRSFKQNYIRNGPDYPSYVTSFINTLAKTKAYLKCHNKGFSCLEFPNNVVHYLERIGQTDPQNLGTFQTSPAVTIPYAGPTRHLEANPKMFSAYMFKYNDPQWWRQWEMQDYRTTNIPVMDHNIIPVHDMGYKGTDITVAILGEGVREHRDLEAYNKSMSYDFCKDSKEQYPTYWWTLSGYYYKPEGNYQAGIIAMNADNGICGVGIAPGARIAAYKMIQCELKRNDIVSRSLSYQAEEIDIFCSTWTLLDDLGQYLEPISKEVENAFNTGIKEGRNGLGSIYIFPSGRNRANSNCAVNAFVNTPYAITIASANQRGKPASYSERCSAVFATAYSGDVGMEGLGTIDANGKCATTPEDLPVGSAVAAGIIALLLQPRPTLTYRDVMHIIAMTAEVAPLANNPDTWFRNAGGFWVSRDFGFGLLNAENMVNLGKKWKKLPNGNSCLIRKKLDEPLFFDHRKSKEVVIDASGCDGAASGITYLEHVKLYFSASYTCIGMPISKLYNMQVSGQINKDDLKKYVSYMCRGAVYLNLTSPAGTTITLLDPREKDVSGKGYQNWGIMATQFWGEDPRGTWTVTVNALEVHYSSYPHGYVTGFSLKLFGLGATPHGHPRKYAAFQLPNGQTSQYS